MWTLKTVKRIRLSRSVLIEGLPGIGNVGKIAADLLLQEFPSELVAELKSRHLPNAVYVREDNLIEAPRIEFRLLKHNKKNFLFLVGDVQPVQEEPSHALAETVINYAKKQGCNEIVTLGGIGLQELPEKPKVFCTANNKAFLKAFEKLGVNTNIYGKVGPIMGMSGLLLSLGEEKRIKAAALLAETLAHPMYIGLKGAKELLKVLNKKYSFQVSLKSLEKEIRSVEKALKKSVTPFQTSSGDRFDEMSYIG